jgi:hypothetical protein
VLTYDKPPSVRFATCASCSGQHETTAGTLLSDGAPVAAYWVTWKPHAEEALVDVTFGTWGTNDPSDHITFGCRVGHIKGMSSPQCSLVAAAQALAASPLLGRKLTRDEALEHPRLGDFWASVDWLVLNDPVLHDHVYHA